MKRRLLDWLLTLSGSLSQALHDFIRITGEQLNNPGFNPIEFEGIKKLASSNNFILSAIRLPPHTIRSSSRIYTMKFEH